MVINMAVRNLRCGQWSRTGSICIVDQSIKRLISPLPKHHSRSGFIKCHHNCDEKILCEEKKIIEITYAL